MNNVTFKTYFDKDKLNSEKNKTFLNIDSIGTVAFLSATIAMFFGDSCFSMYHLSVFMWTIFFSHNLYNDYNKYFVKEAN